MPTERVFAELKSLAGERSSEKRLDLLRKIADLFFARIDEHSEAEASLFNEVIEQVVDQISRDGKIEVATDLATLPGFPSPVVRKFAHDSDIEIARPVLRSALGLTERDLVEIARKASDGHLDVIAGRAQLSEAVSDKSSSAEVRARAAAFQVSRILKGVFAVSVFPGPPSSATIRRRC